MTDKNSSTAGQGGGARAENSQQPNARSEIEKRQPKFSHPADFKDIFRDPRWRPYYHFKPTAPHRVYVWEESDDGKIVAIIVRRTRPEGDWPLGQNALNYTADAERDGRLVEGHILLVDNKWNVIASKRACEVVKCIGNAAPTTGPWSEFYWIDGAFKPTTGRGTNDDEVPF